MLSDVINQIIIFTVKLEMIGALAICFIVIKLIFITTVLVLVIFFSRNAPDLFCIKISNRVDRFDQVSLSS